MAYNNTSYPSFSYLPPQWYHRPRHNFFLDHGTRGSIYINESGETLVQKNHEGNQMRSLRAQFPSLPLFEKPRYGISDIDNVGQETLKEQNKKLQYLIKRIKELKTMFKRKKYDFKDIMNLLKCVCDYENGHGSEEDVFHQFNQIAQLRNMYKRYSTLLDIVDIEKTASAFNGGCLQVLKFPDDPSSVTQDGSVCMTAVSGLKLNEIQIIKADLEDSGLLNVDKSETIAGENQQPLYQLSNQCLYDQSLCAARGNNSILLYKISSPFFGFETSKVDEVNFENEVLTSVCMSPYIPAECLIATRTGSVYLWSVDKSPDLISGKSEALGLQSSWNDVHYGSHPRSFVLTDPNTMDLFDIRTSAGKTTNLFSLPSRHLTDKEKFQVSKYSITNSFQHFLATDYALFLLDEKFQVSKYSITNSFQHFLATDYALFLLDERFPRHPVLQWQHLLKGLPQFMSLVPEVVHSPQEDVLLIGSQYPPEIMSIQYRIPEKEPPVAVCSPWCISKTLDFLYVDNMHCKIEDELMKKRLTTPCIGITGQPLDPEGMLVFQLNSLGDIFFQKYNYTKFGDKTCSAGPGDQVVDLSTQARCRGRYWMEHLREYMQEDYFCEKEHENITSIIKSISNPQNSHVLCRVCMPQCDNEDIESDDADILTEDCMMCDLNLLESKWLVDGIKMDKVIKSTAPPFEKPVSSPSNIPTSSCLTKTLYKLWNDEELNEEEEEEEDDDEGTQDKEDAVPVEEGGGDKLDKGGEEEGHKEGEEEKKEAVMVKEDNLLLQRSSLNFVHWGEDESEEEEEEEVEMVEICTNEYNISSSFNEPDSPLMFEPTQSYKPDTIPDSLPIFLQSPPTQQILSISHPERTPDEDTISHSQISFINRDSPVKSPLTTFSLTNEPHTPMSKQEKAQNHRKCLDFENSSQDSIMPKTRDNLSGFLSPVISQRKIKTPQKTLLRRNLAYEDGFGSIMDSSNMEYLPLLTNMSSQETRSPKKPSLKRNFEEGF